MTTQDKLREKVNGWKKEMNDDKQLAEKQAMDQLAAIAKNKELSDFFNSNADVGSENIAQSSLPALKVHSAGKSTKNILANGEKPTDGFFYYKPTQEQFKTVECHLLYVSGGYYADDMNGKKKWNQIIAGVIDDEGDMKSFIMYINGKKLQNLWNFGKELAPYTKGKPVSIPMFALRVKLSTHSEPNDYGESWLVDFEIMKDAKGMPIITVDEGELRFLRDHVSSIKETIDRLVSSRSGEDGDAPANGNFAATDSQGNPIEDIPFPDEPR